MVPADDYKKNPDTDFKDLEKTGKKEARKQAAALREAIEHHDYLYYVENQPEIADSAYDKLFKRLQELEGKYPDLRTGDSPTEKVGAEPVEKLKKVNHSADMLSLNSVLEAEEVVDYLDSLERKTGEKTPELFLEPKFDGLSIEAVYEKGSLVRGSSRGDGETGEEITHNLKTVSSLPLCLRGDPPEFLAVRGEVLMNREGFQKLNRQRVKEGKEAFANPRNAAAGTMRRLDPKEAAGKPFLVFFYEVLKARAAEFPSHREKLDRLRGWGLPVNPENRPTGSRREVKKRHRQLEQKRDDLDYEIDGMVIKLDDTELRERLGQRQRSPRWALAWKFPPKKEVTRLEDIVVQVGRTGMLTPVALLDPVEVGGVTVSRATLHNADEVKKKDLRPGDTVRVERAGDVIPEVAERIKKPGRKRGKKFEMPDRCPSCGGEVYREGAYYFCPAGLSCRAQLVEKIKHYASREGMNIDGLGEKIIERLVDRGLVEDTADLYRLKPADLEELEGFAEKSARQLHREIRKNMKPELARFLYSLGIRHVGGRLARVLAREFSGLKEIEQAGREDLEAIREIGPKIAESVERFFSDPENRKVLRRLKQAGVKPKSGKPTTKKSTLQGKNFVFTGALDDFTRDQARAEVEKRGGRATSSVSGNTDYLVAGEDPGSKLKEAEEEEAKIIDEGKFKKLLGG